MFYWGVLLLGVVFNVGILVNAIAEKRQEPSWLTDTFHSLGGPTEIPAWPLFENPQEEALSGFHHHMFLLKAMQMGHSNFAVQEKTKTGSHDTRTQYLLKKNVVLLDVHGPEVIRELSDRHILHCGAAALDNVAPGHLIVGSDKSAWFRARHLSSWVAATARIGLVLGRRVVRVEKTGESCAKLHTEPIHHLELFESMRIESLADHPQARALKALEESKAKAAAEAEASLVSPPAPAPARKLQLQVPTKARGGAGMPEADQTPDAPPANQIKNCDPPNSSPWAEKIGLQYKCTAFGQGCNDGIGVSYQSGTSGKFDYDFFLSQTSGCASLTYTANGMNFNWTPDPTGDPTKGTVTKKVMELNGVTGVECHNCYAYAGAQLYAIFEYKSKGELFLGEVKVSGAAGFNVDMKIVDPAVQATSLTPLVAADAEFGDPILLGSTGLQLSFRMGGLSGSVSGSGGLKGSANFGAGLSVSLSAGVLLNGGTESTPKQTLSFPVKFESKWVPPFFTTSGFTPIASSSLQVALTATEYIRLAYVVGPLSVGLESKVDVIGMTGIGGSASAAAALVVVEPVVSDHQNRLLKGPPTSSLHLVPGSRIVIKYQYANAAPGERHRLFYAIRHVSGRSESIMQRDFVNADSGSGVHSAEWVVPWQMSLAGQDTPIVFTVRSSSDMMAEPVESATHRITAFTESDSLISQPSAGDTLPLDKAFDVVWKPELLHLFDDSMPATPPYHGQERSAQSVYVSLVSLTEGAPGEAPRRDSWPIAQGLPNSGRATVSLNSTTLKRWLSVPRRHWLEVHEGRFGSSYGWSAGYLRVDRVPSTRPLRMSAALMRATKSSFTAAPGRKPYVKLSNALTTPPRQLASCDTAANVPVTTSFAFNGRPDKIFLEFSITLWGFEIVKLDHKFELPSTAPVTPVGPPQSVCINLAAAAAAGPPGGGGGGSGGSSSSGGANGGGNSPSSAVIGGAVGGVVIFLALLAGGYYYFHSHKSSSDVDGDEDATAQQPESFPDPYSTQPRQGAGGMQGTELALAANPMFHGQEPTRPSMEYAAAGQGRPSAAGITWQMFLTEEGAPYWYCEATGAQVWEQPAGWVPPQQLQEYQPQQETYSYEQGPQYEEAQEFQGRASASLPSPRPQYATPSPPQLPQYQQQQQQQQQQYQQQYQQPVAPLRAAGPLSPPTLPPSAYSKAPYAAPGPLRPQMGLPTRLPVGPSAPASLFAPSGPAPRLIVAARPSPATSPSGYPAVVAGGRGPGPAPVRPTSAGRGGMR